MLALDKSTNPVLAASIARRAPGAPVIPSAAEILQLAPPVLLVGKAKHRSQITRKGPARQQLATCAKMVTTNPTLARRTASLVPRASSPPMPDQPLVTPVLKVSSSKIPQKAPVINVLRESMVLSLHSRMARVILKATLAAPVSLASIPQRLGRLLAMPVPRVFTSQTGVQLVASPVTLVRRARPPRLTLVVVALPN